jgi:hypothetical protein
MLSDGYVGWMMRWVLAMVLGLVLVPSCYVDVADLPAVDGLCPAPGDECDAVLGCCEHQVCVTIHGSAECGSEGETVRDVCAERCRVDADCSDGQVCECTGDDCACLSVCGISGS